MYEKHIFQILRSQDVIPITIGTIFLVVPIRNYHHNHGIEFNYSGKFPLAPLRLAPSHTQHKVTSDLISVNTDLFYLLWNKIVYFILSWLLFSLNIMFLRFIHIVVNSRSLFLFIVEQNSIVWMYHICYPFIY